VILNNFIILASYFKTKTMKKGILVAALAVLALASCKKDYVCECTTLGVSGTTTLNDTKSNATETCENGSGTTLGITTTCVIK